MSKSTLEQNEASGSTPPSSAPKTSKAADADEKTPLVPKRADNADTQGSTGLSMGQTAFLIAGQIAGSGVLALPRALTKTGWLGVPLIVVICLVAAFSGQRLGDCWSMLEARNPEMRSRKRNPYSIIAEQALGKKWSVVVSMSMIITLFGVSLVCLLLAAQIIQFIMTALLPTITICWWYLIIIAALTPFAFFKTPKDFHMLGTLAFVSAMVACLLYFIQMMSETSPYKFTFRYGLRGFMSFFLAFGTIMFAFGGASTFPTIQNDMTDKKKFGKALQRSFGAILAIYLLVAVTGYAVYGDRVLPDVALSIMPTPLSLSANVFMAIHLLSAFVIIINPVFQEVEELYNVPGDSVGWRMGVRLSIMAALLFIGESIPRFDTILALIGATTVAVLTYILPSVCYLRLIGQPAGEGQNPIPEPGWRKIVCYQVIGLGVLGGIAATISALDAVFSSSATLPCFVR